jgi:hypothetical protein
MDIAQAPVALDLPSTHARSEKMGRHNRDARGADQRGFDYDISYQPDWLRQIKVTRTLENGRQSTKILFRNPTPGEQPAGSKVRTRIASAEQSLDVEVDITDPHGVVKRIIVVTAPGNTDTPGDELEFTIVGAGRDEQRSEPEA